MSIEWKFICNYPFNIWLNDFNASVWRKIDYFDNKNTVNYSTRRMYTFICGYNLPKIGWINIDKMYLITNMPQA
jgi:hypothetical protein